MKGKYFDIHKVTSHPYCCSLGLHADFKNRYVAFHFLWFYIHIGKTRQATFKSMKDQKDALETLLRRDAIKPKYIEMIKMMIENIGKDITHPTALKELKSIKREADKKLK